MRIRRVLVCSSAAMLWIPLAVAQTPAAPASTTPPADIDHPASASSNVVPEPVDKRILGVLPNYRTVNPTTDYEPISAKHKLLIASKDSFDWPSYLTAAPFSLISQLNNDNPSFGQGVKGYARRYGTAIADQVDGNMLTEGIMPSLLREDPRYFRMGAGNGTFKHRFWYSATRTLVTRTDAGGRRVNLSELLGNGIDAAIGNAYYPDSRGLSDTMQRMATYIGTDTFSNILKEFWPDIKHHFRKNKTEAPLSSSLTP